MHDMIMLFTVDEQAKSVSQAEGMIGKHSELKVSNNLYVFWVDVCWQTDCTIRVSGIKLPYLTYHIFSLSPSYQTKW